MAPVHLRPTKTPSTSPPSLDKPISRLLISAWAQELTSMCSGSRYTEQQNIIDGAHRSKQNLQHICAIGFMERLCIRAPGSEHLVVGCCCCWRCVQADCHSVHLAACCAIDSATGLLAMATMVHHPAFSSTLVRAALLSPLAMPGECSAITCLGRMFWCRIRSE